MKRLFAFALVLCGAFAGLLAARTTKLAAAAETSAVQADRALGEAFEKGNLQRIRGQRPRLQPRKWAVQTGAASGASA